MRRRAKWFLGLLLLGGIGLLTPSAWFWISTAPESSYFSYRGPGGGRALRIGARANVSFDLDTAKESVRVLRWGEHRGKRQGSYRCYDGGGWLRITGQYDRGVRTGRWTVFDAGGTPLVDGEYDASGEPDGLWLDHVDGFVVRIEYEHGRIRRWCPGSLAYWAVAPEVSGTVEIDCVPAPSSPSSRRIGLMEYGPSDTGHWGHSTIGTWIQLTDQGAIEASGPIVSSFQCGLWTFFGADGEIIRQEVNCERIERRTAPPWYDLAPSFDPSLPVLDPETGEQTCSAVEFPLQHPRRPR
jgi:hypothetical protein